MVQPFTSKPLQHQTSHWFQMNSASMVQSCHTTRSHVRETCHSGVGLSKKTVQSKVTKEPIVSSAGSILSSKKSLMRCIHGKRAFNAKVDNPINPLSCKAIKEHGLNQGGKNTANFCQSPAIGRLGIKDEFLGCLHARQGDDKRKKKERHQSKGSCMSQARINANE